MMLTDLADVLRNAGLEVVEEPGWKQRGHGPMTDVLGVTCHHTANGGAPGVEPSRAVVRDGRPGLDGPLAHLLLRTDGVYRVIAAGLCYHAGVSRRSDQTNSHRIGIEAEAKGVPGTATDWSAVQMDAYRRGCRALMENYGFGLEQVLGHKETCAPPRRKSDPDFDMSDFRHGVAKVNLRVQESDGMDFQDKHKLTTADVAAMGSGAVGELRSYDEMLRFPPAVARLRREQTAGFAALTAAVSALAGAVAAGGTLTEAQITAAAQAGATAALAKLGDALN